MRWEMLELGFLSCALALGLAETVGKYQYVHMYPFRSAKF